jgi:hypothetical protein
MSNSGWNINIPHFDKVLHAGIFGVFAWLTARYLHFQKRVSITPKQVWWVSLGLAFAYGGITELLQYTLFDYRTGDWIDLGADTLGAAIALYLWDAVRLERLKDATLPSHESVEPTSAS